MKKSTNKDDGAEIDCNGPVSLIFGIGEAREPEYNILTIYYISYC
jgi:hypothetical protein